MNPKKNTTSTTESPPVSEPKAGGEAPTKQPYPLYVRSNVSNPSGKDPPITLSIYDSVPIRTPTPITTNTFVDPNEKLKTVTNGIIEAIPSLISPIYYEPETVLLQLEELKQELIYAAANYKVTLPHPKKYHMLVIDALIKIFSRHLWDHQSYPSTSLNLNPYLKYEATLKPHNL